MAKEKTVTKGLREEVSANFTATPKGDLAETESPIGGLIYKGKITTDKGVEKAGFQAVIDGEAGEIRNSMKAAIVQALTLQNVVPANYEYPEKWSEVYKDNKPKAPESLDDLDADKVKAFKAGYAEIGKALEAEAKADFNKRDKAFALADKVHSIRDGMTSSDWALFRKLAPDTATADFLGKNVVSEAYRSSVLRAVDGFDADTMLPPRANSNKGVCSAYSKALGEVAEHVVEIINSSDACKALEIDFKASSSVKVRLAFEDYVSREAYGLNEADMEERSKALAALVVPLHVENWPDDLALFDLDDAKVSVAKVEGSAVAKTLFGLEGSDELLAAIARSMSNRITRAATADVADAAREMVKEARETKLPFAKWPEDRQAAHVANILLSIYPEDGTKAEKEAASDRLDSILGTIESWITAVSEGTMTKADILNPETPENEEDASDAADAETS